MKNQWNQFPFVLRRKILLTFLAGLASIALSLIIFIITTDHILLVLGSIIFLASLVLVAFADLIAMDCHEQYLLLTDEHHTLFCAGDASVEQISIEHDSMCL